MRRSLGVWLAIVLAVPVALSTLTGARSTLGIPLPIVLLLGVAIVLLYRGRPVRTVEVSWAGQALATTPLAQIPLRPNAMPRTGGGSVAASVARVEARELVRSPWFAAGIGFWAMLLFTLGFLFSHDFNRSWWEFFGLTTMMCHPFAGMAVIAAHRNRSRGARDGCDELFDTCPADADARTLGHLATAWIGGAVCVVGVLVLIALITARDGHSYGPVDHEAVAAVIACAVIGGGAVALGVTLGRWARFALVPVAVVVGIGLLGRRINRIGMPAWSPDRYLSSFVASIGMDTLYFTRPVWARLVWLVALAVLVGALGLVGFRLSRHAMSVAAGAAVVAIVAAVLVVHAPPRRDVARIAGRILDPLAHSTCVAAGAEVRACAYDEYSVLARRTADALRPVAAAVPAGILDDVTFLQRFDHADYELQPEVVAALDGRLPALPAHPLRLRFHATDGVLVAARLRLAAYAVGLPTEAGARRRGEIVAGQSRGVVVLWLATRGLRGRSLRSITEEVTANAGESNDATARGAVWPAACEDEPPVLNWAPKDLAAVRSLLTLRDDRVQRLLADQWSRFTAPTTTTDELLVAAGLAPLGRPEAIEARDMTC
jgi:hypothetical protein